MADYEASLAENMCYGIKHAEYGNYRQFANIRRTQSQNINGSRLVL